VCIECDFTRDSSVVNFPRGKPLARPEVTQVDGGAADDYLSDPVRRENSSLREVAEVQAHVLIYRLLETRSCACFHFRVLDSTNLTCVGVQCKDLAKLRVKELISVLSLLRAHNFRTSDVYLISVLRVVIEQLFAHRCLVK
jgi:hypothetical protein